MIGARSIKAVAVVLAFSLVPLAGVSLKANAAEPRVTNDHVHNKGTVAFVSASSQVPKTCSDGAPGTDRTRVAVFGSENITRTDGTKTASTRLFLSVAKIDSCGPIGTIAFGELVNPPMYEQHNTDSARMSGTIPLSDGVTGNDVGVAVVDLSLTSIAKPTRGSLVEKFSTQGVRVQIRQSGSNADAAVTGSLTLNGQDLLAGTDIAGSLGTNTLGTTSVVKVRS